MKEFLLFLIFALLLLYIAREKHVPQYHHNRVLLKEWM
jgi:hypothetical protein